MEPVCAEAKLATSIVYQVLGKHFSSPLGRDIDPNTEILVTVGATEGIQLAMQAFVEKGDEVLALTPFFDSYLNSGTISGGHVKGVPLEPASESRDHGHLRADDWRINFESLESNVTTRTKMLIINTPHNPTGNAVYDEI
jgi:kynurenine aminotransferase